MVLFGLVPGLNLNAAQKYSAVPGKSSGARHLMDGAVAYGRQPVNDQPAMIGCSVRNHVLVLRQHTNTRVCARYP
jgi:hypothetical protein